MAHKTRLTFDDLSCEEKRSRRSSAFIAGSKPDSGSACCVGEIDDRLALSAQKLLAVDKCNFLVVVLAHGNNTDNSIYLTACNLLCRK